MSCAIFRTSGASLVVVKNLLAMQEMQIQPLGQEDLLKKEMASHSSILAWKIPWREKLGGLRPRGRKSQAHLVTKQQWHFSQYSYLAFDYYVSNVQLSFLLFCPQRPGQVSHKTSILSELAQLCPCPLDSNEIKAVIPQGNQPWILEELMLKLTLQ